jgi:PAT family beta-lactamase induction signal transducer AmpG
LWLKDDGLSRSSIGWAGLIFSVYALNFIWAPFVDKLKIPLLTNKIGQRKSWILILQSLIILFLICWFFLNPRENLIFVILIGLLIAICSATQDITLDALRIEQVNSDEKELIAAGASMMVIGWWTGFKLGGLVSLLLADFFETLKFENYWQITFIILAMIMVIFNIGVLFIKEKNNHKIIEKEINFNHLGKSNFKKMNDFLKYFYWLFYTFANPILDFFKKNGLAISIAILSFIFLFKIGEAFLGRMSVLFYNELGFSKTDIGIFSKGLGWVTTIVFTLLGGLLTIKSGVIRAVFLAGIFMASTNLLFALLAISGKNYSFFAFAVIIDDIAASFATVAFVAFISQLIDRNYTATQYALLASIGTLGRTTLASSSGELVDYLGGNWAYFFSITCLMVIPSLIILLLIRKKIKLH